VPLGIEHDLPENVVAEVLREARPRLAFASDPASAERLVTLNRQGAVGDGTVVASGLEGSARVLALEQLLDLGSILDTAERAQSFRAVSRQVDPQGLALWHAGAEGATRLTHAEAMRRVEPGLRARPAREGDVAFVGGPRVEVATRLALAAFLGDGLTTTALEREGRADEDVAVLRPHKMLIPGEWLEAACRDQGPRWPAGLDRPWARRRLLERLGQRLRWVETSSPVGEPTVRALDAAGVSVHMTKDGAGKAGRETSNRDTVH
jgi:hypothetical protein